jgi:hypothetical protein
VSALSLFKREKIQERDGGVDIKKLNVDFINRNNIFWRRENFVTNHYTSWRGVDSP